MWFGSSLLTFETSPSLLFTNPHCDLSAVSFCLQPTLWFESSLLMIETSPCSECSPENVMCCVVFTVIYWICTVQSDTFNFSKGALSYTLFVWDDQRPAYFFKLVCALHHTQDFGGKSSLADCAPLLSGPESRPLPPQGGCLKQTPHLKGMLTLGRKTTF